MVPILQMRKIKAQTTERGLPWVTFLAFIFIQKVFIKYEHEITNILVGYSPEYLKKQLRHK